MPTLSTTVRTASRARSLWYAIISGIFTALLAFVTIRFTLGGVSVESFILVALTLMLALQTRRWYQRFRSTGGD